MMSMTITMSFMVTISMLVMVLVTILITMTIAHMKIGWCVMVIWLRMVGFMMRYWVWVVGFMMVWCWMVGLVMIRLYMMICRMVECCRRVMWSKAMEVWSMNFPKKSKISLG